MSFLLKLRDRGFEMSTRWGAASTGWPRGHPSPQTAAWACAFRAEDGVRPDHRRTEMNDGPGGACWPLTPTVFATRKHV